MKLYEMATNYQQSWTVKQPRKYSVTVRRVLYKEYQETTKTVTAARTINPHDHGRVEELLIMNYKTSD